MARLAPGSIWTDEDQKRWYAEQKGMSKLEAQVHLGNIAAGRCSCDPVKVTRRWQNLDKATTRTVHMPNCAKWKGWMAEVRPKE